MIIRAGLPKLVATDLDGTVVRSDETVSSHTHQVLERVRATGIPVVGVTGRGPRLLDVTQRDLPEADYLVMAQGGTVLDLTGPGEPVRICTETVPGRVVESMLAAIEGVVGPLSMMVEALDAPGAPLWGDPNAAW